MYYYLLLILLVFFFFYLSPRRYGERCVRPSRRRSRRTPSPRGGTTYVRETVRGSDTETRRP